MFSGSGYFAYQGGCRENSNVIAIPFKLNLPPHIEFDNNTLVRLGHAISLVLLRALWELIRPIIPASPD